MIYCTILVLLILFGFFFYFKKKNNNELNIGLYILFFYILSVSLTFFARNDNVEFSIIASLFFTICLLLYLTPILRLNLNPIIVIKTNHLKVFNFFSWFFILSGVLSYFYFLPVVYRLFASGESLLILRTDMVGGISYVTAGPLNIFLNFTSQFYPIVILFYFYSIAFLEKSKFFNRMLLFSSTAYIVNVLSGVGRDGVVLWLMSFLFSYVLFKKNLLYLQKKKIKKLFWSMFIIGMLFFVSITISRFFLVSDSSGEGFYSIIGYSGEQFSNFNNLFNRIPHPEKYGSFIDLFPIFNLFESKHSDFNFLEQWENNKLYLGLDPNVFSSYIGSFYLKIGAFGTFVLSLFAFLAGLYFVSKGKQTIDFSLLLLITLYSQIPLHGFFYYKLGYTVSDLYIISVLFMTVLFKRRKNTKSLTS